MGQYLQLVKEEIEYIKLKENILSEIASVKNELLTLKRLIENGLLTESTSEQLKRILDQINNKLLVMKSDVALSKCNRDTTLLRKHIIELEATREEIRSEYKIAKQQEIIDAKLKSSKIR